MIRPTSAKGKPGQAVTGIEGQQLLDPSKLRSRPRPQRGPLLAPGMARQGHHGQTWPRRRCARRERASTSRSPSPSSRLAQSGLDPVGVQRQMGHARPSITMDLYVHEFETARRREQVSDHLAAALGGLIATEC